MKSSLLILLYHDICKNFERDIAITNPVFTTELSRFEYHIQWLINSRFKFICLNDWIDMKKRNKWSVGQYVLLTFDGPHIGWFRWVLPLLKNFGVPATFFVTAGWVGERHPYPESQHLTWHDIKSIEENVDKYGQQLFDIGSHSMWHTSLDRKKNESERVYQERLQVEIVDATNLIRSHISTDVRAYAPPKGVGNRYDLLSVFKLANLEAVRWANLPGNVNLQEEDLFDLQISYCDTFDQPRDRLINKFSNKPSCICRRFKKRIFKKLRNKLYES